MLANGNGKNAVIWGFSSNSTAKAIDLLKKNNSISVEMWIGSTPSCTHNIVSFLLGEFEKVNYQGKKGTIYDEIYYETLYTFMDMMSRHSFYSEKSFHDHLHIYNMLYDYFSSILMNKHIEVVLFSNLPHEGPDFLLYSIAKKLNIRTVLFYQSLFPDRFFYVFNLDDFGSFSEINESESNLSISIGNKFEKDLFYMKSITKHNYPFFCLGRSSYKNLLFCIKSGIIKGRNLSSLKNFINRYSDTFESSCSVCEQKPSSFEAPRKMKSIPMVSKILISKGSSASLKFAQRYFSYKKSKKHFIDLSLNEVDFSQKYVYFPLHLQPELTTSSIGGIHVDQLLAIERLSSILPDDWYIYVKENPKQTEQMRGEWFFERLSLIKNLKLVPFELNTYSLMENSKFVSTITGTAGWEAISGGKNVLIFGDAWYKTLPGVFVYDNNFNLEEILNYEIDHNHLEERLNILLKKTGCGVTDEFYSKLVEDFTPEKNAFKLANFIKNIIV